MGKLMELQLISSFAPIYELFYIKNNSRKLPYFTNYSEMLNYS